MPVPSRRDFEAVLGTGEWIVGAAPMIADLSVVAQLDEIVRTGRHSPMIRNKPRVWAWMNRTRNRVTLHVQVRVSP